MFTCPVCFYNEMEDAPRDYNICECCGTEFGSDDEEHSTEELRAHWLAQGATWFFGTEPRGWNPYVQLLKANVGLLPYHVKQQLYGGHTSYTFISAPQPTPNSTEEFQLALAS